jgi:hypothetical protein
LKTAVRIFTVPGDAEGPKRFSSPGFRQTP